MAELRAKGMISGTPENNGQSSWAPSSILVGAVVGAGVPALPAALP